MNARQCFQRMLDQMSDSDLESLWILVEVMLENYKPVRRPK